MSTYEEAAHLAREELLQEEKQQVFTTEDADRLLGLGDQFLEDWALDAVNENSRDEDYEERNAEWEIYRPLFVAAPDMLEALEKAQKVIAELISPDAIKQTTVMHTWAHLMEAEVTIRAALTKAKAVQL